MANNHCTFWLPKKKRFCANSPLSDSPFCGNHTQRPDAQWIPCPIDPSHSVLEDNLESHLSRCPMLKQSQSLSSLPFYQKGINAGTETGDIERNDKKDCIFTSEIKRNAVHAMMGAEFVQLIDKIKSVHAAICSDIPDSYKISDACTLWTNGEVDKKLPYQEKHVFQQASILGNLEEFSVLRKPSSSGNTTSKENDSSRESHKDPSISAVVEFGAGRGYLTQMLADCYGISKVILVERKAYKLKADRSLRQKESLVLERLRIDIEDLNLNAVRSLQGIGYLAIGKHLCGPATDMTLRCCIRERYDDSTTQSQTHCFLRGLAIATCCHHLCQWKNYINKKYMSDLGFSKEEFHAMTWLTSWAVDADHGSGFSVTDYSTQVLDISKKKGSVTDKADSREVVEIIRDMEAIDRAILGYMCKDIIDSGRLMWIKAQGMKSKLVKYVPSTISPENRLLVAK